MADIKPFKAIRPRKGLERQIAALPYDVYSREEAKREVEKEPLSFLRIDRAETLFPDNVDAYADVVYEKAHDLLWEMVKNGEMEEDPVECYYVYELVKQYNQFYHDYSILKEEDKAVKSLRLDLCDATAKVVSTGMGLLGIRVPERM